MTPPSAPTVLVVDDEQDVLKLVENVLTKAGYDVILSRGAESAIAAFTQMASKPDLLLTDVVMPGMSGPMLVDHLLALEPNLRVLFMSGYDERQVVQRYVVERGFDLVTKPFTLQRLSSAVKKSLESTPSPVGGSGSGEVQH